MQSNDSRLSVACAARLRRVVRAIRAGGVIAYPTEAVFGLGCDPWNAAAVERLLKIKRRPWRKGLILIAAAPAQLEPFVDRCAGAAWERALATWPGPTTWLVPTRSTGLQRAQREQLARLAGGRTTLAVRVTAHPAAAALCRAAGSALVSTSANRADRPPARSALATRRLFGREVAAIAPGQIGGARRPTTIRDGRDGGVIRL